MIRGLLLMGYVGVVAIGGGVGSLLSPSVDPGESTESIRLKGVEEPGVLGRRYGLEVVPVPESPFKSVEEASAPEASSGCALEVRAVVTSDAPERGFAVVLVGGSNSIVRVGEKIFVGSRAYRLSRIEKDHILLKRGRRQLRCPLQL